MSLLATDNVASSRDEEQVYAPIDFASCDVTWGNLSNVAQLKAQKASYEWSFWLRFKQENSRQTAGFCHHTEAPALNCYPIISHGSLCGLSHQGSFYTWRIFDPLELFGPSPFCQTPPSAASPNRALSTHVFLVCIHVNFLNMNADCV